MLFNPKTKALAYRVWCFCKPLDWNCDVMEIAEALRENPQRIASVIRLEGWQRRLRAPRSFGSTGRTCPRT